MIKTVYKTYNNGGIPNLWFNLTITGIGNISGLKVNAKVVSDTYAIDSGTVYDHDTNTFN